MLGNFVYTTSFARLIIGDTFSITWIATIALGLPLYLMVSEKIDKMFGR